MSLDFRILSINTTHNLVTVDWGNKITEVPVEVDMLYGDGATESRLINFIATQKPVETGLQNVSAAILELVNRHKGVVGDDVTTKINTTPDGDEVVIESENAVSEANQNTVKVF